MKNQSFYIAFLSLIISTCLWAPAPRTGYELKAPETEKSAFEVTGEKADIEFSITQKLYETADTLLKQQQKKVQTIADDLAKKEDSQTKKELEDSLNKEKEKLNQYENTFKSAEADYEKMESGNDATKINLADQTQKRFESVIDGTQEQETQNVLDSIQREINKLQESVTQATQEIQPGKQTITLPDETGIIITDQTQAQTGTLSEIANWFKNTYKKFVINAVKSFYRIPEDATNLGPAEQAYKNKQDEFTAAIKEFDNNKDNRNRALSWILTSDPKYKAQYDAVMSEREALVKQFKDDLKGLESAKNAELNEKYKTAVDNVKKSIEQLKSSISSFKNTKDTDVQEVKNEIENTQGVSKIEAIKEEFKAENGYDIPYVTIGFELVLTPDGIPAVRTPNRDIPLVEENAESLKNFSEAKLNTTLSLELAQNPSLIDNVRKSVQEEAPLEGQAWFDALSPSLKEQIKAYDAIYKNDPSRLGSLQEGSVSNVINEINSEFAQKEAEYPETFSSAQNVIKEAQVVAYQGVSDAQWDLPPV